MIALAMPALSLPTLPFQIYGSVYCLGIPFQAPQQAAQLETPFQMAQNGSKPLPVFTNLWCRKSDHVEARVSSISARSLCKISARQTSLPMEETSVAMASWRWRAT